LLLKHPLGKEALTQPHDSVGIDDAFIEQFSQSVLAGASIPLAAPHIKRTDRGRTIPLGCLSVSSNEAHDRNSHGVPAA
jgi:hypothetical protein